MLFTKTPLEAAEAVGRRVQRLRLQRNITQAELAERAGISRPTLGALERHGKATVETLARVMYALGRDAELDQLLPPDPPSTLTEAVTPSTRKRARG